MGSERSIWTFSSTIPAAASLLTSANRAANSSMSQSTFGCAPGLAAPGESICFAHAVSSAMPNVAMPRSSSEASCLPTAASEANRMP
eukprot:2402476-Prymnesium_polylepis.1